MSTMLPNFMVTRRECSLETKDKERLKRNLVADIRTRGTRLAIYCLADQARIAGLSSDTSLHDLSVWIAGHTPEDSPRCQDETNGPSSVDYRVVGPIHKLQSFKLQLLLAAY